MLYMYYVADVLGLIVTAMVIKQRNGSNKEPRIAKNAEICM